LAPRSRDLAIDLFLRRSPPLSLGLLDVSTARQLAARGSLSGALIGGLWHDPDARLRELATSATANQRALVSGLVLMIVAQASLRDALLPLQEMLSEWWTVHGGEWRTCLPSPIAGPGWAQHLRVGCRRRASRAARFSR